MGKIRNGITKNCKVCEKEFYVPSYRSETAKFCSIDCQNHKQHDKWIFNCLGCGKECIFPPCRKYENKKFCSMACRTSVSMSIMERRKQQKLCIIKKRGFSSSRTVRNSIFKIIKKKCEVCGYNQYDFCLDIHHIDENPSNNMLDNLIILCVICHRKHHKGIIDAVAERKKEYREEY